MQIVLHTKPEEEKKQTSAEQSRLLLWACAGLLETLCLLGGIYWIMLDRDPRPLMLRVLLVAALAVVCGVGTLLAYKRSGRDR
jgi:hypothetical protein